MKAIIAIWALALIVGVGSVTYVNAEINKMAVENRVFTLQAKLQPAKPVQKTQPAAQLMNLSPGVEMTQLEMLRSQAVELEVR